MNQVLLRTKAAVLERVLPELRASVDQFAAEALHNAAAQAARDELTQAGAEPAPEQIAAAVLAMLTAAAHGTAQTSWETPGVVTSVGVVVLCEALLWIEHDHQQKVTAAFLNNCCMALMPGLLRFCGVTPEKLRQMLDLPAAQSSGPRDGAQTQALARALALFKPVAKLPFADQYARTCEGGAAMTGDRL